MTGQVRGAWLWALILAALAAWFGAPPAAAQEASGKLRPDCHMATSQNVTVSSALRGDAPWVCEHDRWDPTKTIAWLRFDAAQWDAASPPTGFYSRFSRFRSVELIAVDRDGSRRSAHIAASESRPLQGGPYFTVPLPEITPDTVTLLVRIERPHSVKTMSEARITNDLGDASWPIETQLALTMLVGMLLMPLAFDILFYVVLRERFVIWHAVIASSMIGFILISSGLITSFKALPVVFLGVASTLVWTIGAAASALFAASFLEEDALSPGMRRALRLASVWTILVPGYFSLQPDAVQSFSTIGYYFGYIPLLVIYVLTLAQALRRGSRAARFLAVAWVPIMLSVVERLLRALGLYSAPSQIDLLLFFALGMEVIIIALAVGDRFLTIRKERDRALTEARTMEKLSERDPLTGLMNRRAMETRFSDMKQAGYRTFAVLDIDHFKAINDDFGHAVGDDVLRAIAAALREDDNICGVRVGGEEFFLLVTGIRPVQRAERCRKAISRQVAQDVDTLDRPVTASMGIVNIPAAKLPDVTFESVYKRADKLLYKAKEAGRNQMMSRLARKRFVRGEQIV